MAIVIAYVQVKGGDGKTTGSVHECIWYFDNVDGDVGYLDCDWGNNFQGARWIEEVEPAIAVERAVTPAQITKALAKLRAKHQYIFVDCPKGFDPKAFEKQSLAVLLHADRVRVPVEPSGQDLDVLLSSTTKLIQAAQRRRGGELQDVRIVVNKLDRRTKRSRGIDKYIEKHAQFPVAKNMVARLSKISDGFGLKPKTVAVRMKDARQANDELNALFTELMKPVQPRSNRGKVANG